MRWNRRCLKTNRHVKKVFKKQDVCDFSELLGFRKLFKSLFWDILEKVLLSFSKISKDSTQTFFLCTIVLLKTYFLLDYQQVFKASLL